MYSSTYGHLKASTGEEGTYVFTYVRPENELKVMRKSTVGLCLLEIERKKYKISF